jgi:hypothetical protein
MNKSKRDLLVLLNQTIMSPKSIEFEVEQLHDILNNAERLDNLISAHEIININKYKVTSSYLTVLTFFRSRKEKPFVFLNCKN